MSGLRGPCWVRWVKERPPSLTEGQRALDIIAPVAASSSEEVTTTESGTLSSSPLSSWSQSSASSSGNFLRVSPWAPAFGTASLTLANLTARLPGAQRTLRKAFLMVADRAHPTVTRALEHDLTLPATSPRSEHSLPRNRHRP